MKIQSYGRYGDSVEASGKRAVEKLIRDRVDELCDEFHSRADNEHAQISVRNAEGWSITVFVHGLVECYHLEQNHPTRYLFDVPPNELIPLLLDLATCDMEKVLTRRWSTKRQRPFYLYAKYPKTPDLFRAVASGDVEWAKAELAVGADVNHRDEQFNTPLHTAALGGWVEMCRLLLESGADATAKDGNGGTPADYARHSDEYLHDKEEERKLVAMLEEAAKKFLT